MSAYYSRFRLNTYSAMPYFLAHIPPDYPIGAVMLKSHAFRCLPPNLRKLSGLAKRWAIRHFPAFPAGQDSIEKWYDADGYELNPYTGQRLTDEEIDAEWSPNPELDDFVVTDIPIPPDGFADPDTWEEPLPIKEPTDPADILTEEGILNDIKSRGRDATAEEYGVVDMVHRITSDKQLVQAILERR